MIVTVDLALRVLPVLAELVIKIAQVIKSGNPVDIEEELKALEECRLRSSEEIIKEVDNVNIRGSED